MAYQELRLRALKLNEQQAGKHPCSMGNGGCCEPDIAMSNNDALNIRQAALQGRIHLNVISDAKRRVRDKNRERCAFLGDNNQCTIYEDRPLICILTGAGGKPITTDTLRAVADFRAIGQDTEISCRRVNDPSCRDCFKVMEQGDYKYKASAIAEFDEILKEDLARGIVFMSKVIKDLPSGR